MAFARVLGAGTSRMRMLGDALRVESDAQPGAPEAPGRGGNCRR